MLRSDFKDNERMLLSKAMPELAAELSALLTAAEEPGLAQQMSTLEIVDRCRCGDDFCGSFYTAAKPKGAYGPTHRNVSLHPSAGMLILDVVDEKVCHVEVLFRDELRRKLYGLMP